MKLTTLTKILLAVFLGGALGFSYYYFIGCDSACAIQSSWINSTAYGAFTGLVIALPSKKKSDKSTQ
jgi:ABC-type enterobactin transport system permease subunit